MSLIEDFKKLIKNGYYLKKIGYIKDKVAIINIAFQKELNIIYRFFEKMNDLKN
ncbi:hypothetical protein LCGC14_0606830 [marine sediment metagenome]|uniref:Uncharacterized protein n=1 Tax=marine sediment metagenome TaxID=412755 RepID=A0A0F9RDN9_9ZZZZ